MAREVDTSTLDPLHEAAYSQDIVAIMSEFGSILLVYQCSVQVLLEQLNLLVKLFGDRLLRGIEHKGNMFHRFR